MKKLLLLPLAAALAVLSCNTSFAAALASDNAADSAYSGGWTSGLNGGTGFGGWNLVTSVTPGGAAGFFKADSTTTVGANINTSGTSFGMYGEAPSWTEADAYRSFTGNLTAGQTFSIDLAVNYRNGAKGIDIRDASNAKILNFNIGGDDYVVSNATTGNGSIGNAYSSNTAFHLSLTQTDGSGGTWSIVRSGGVSSTSNGTYSGVAAGIKLYIFNTDAGGPNNLMLNSLAIVPEPATIGLLLGGAGLLAFVRRRRA
jgi:hypothetical protein